MTFKLRTLAPIAAGLLAGVALAPTAALADTLVDNVQGVTIGENGQVERFTGFVFDDDGRITQVLERGDDRPRKVQYRVDGQGRFVVPGMIDSHLHVMDLGFGQLTLDLSATRTLEEALAAIARFAADNPGRPWILGRGWNQEKWGLGRYPTAAELDGVVPDRPVYLERADNHAGWVNSLAMQAAGITAQSSDPAGGMIVRTPGSRAPAGVFIDNAQDAIKAVVPAPRPADRDQALRKAQQVLVANGVTAVADMGTTIADWQTYRRAGDRGELKLRIVSYAKSLADMELIAGPGQTPWLYGDRLRLNGIKLVLDGALGSRGAWLKQPYADAPGSSGLPMLSSAQLRNLMSRAAMENFQIAVHAIGDAANSDILNAIAELSQSYPGDRRWRIEHAQIVDPAELAAFGRLGVVASMQPLHQPSDRLMAEARLGQARLGGAYAWRSIAAGGATLAFGSDAPVEPPLPFAGWAAAMSRTDANGEPFGGWLPQQVVSRETALAAFTSDGARAAFAEGRFGRMRKGERADFVILDRDPMLASPAELREIGVLQTWIGGEKVFGQDLARNSR